MKDKVWLSRPKKKKHWHYGLARYADGSIRVSEILFCDGFTPVGSYNNGLPCRLYPGEREKIVKDLYVACCRELGFKPDEKIYNP